MGYGQVIWNWLEGLLSSLFSEVLDQITGVFDDLHFSLIESLFENIVSGNSDLQEIFELLHGLIAFTQALGDFAGSLVYLGFAIVIIKMLKTVFSII
ncbi:hypothetical protein [Methanogenium organophilum]|uniref:Uncharacterized protein n=1 Tax=Methanogenium organophilum TaxID=2199 RepID=A0A9X9S542_METOG|nr:hypothetical protein [Methanogenium organophilum]WAI02234.1 hypothetical protein OU421_05015 [Methanogenium organophilum]